MRIGEMLLGDAQKGVLASLDRDHDGGIDDEDAAASPEGVALDAWVAKTLPAVDAKRRTLLVRALLGEDLRLETLRLAAQLPSSFRVLTEMLGVDAQLSSGEKVQLAASLIGQAQTMVGPV